MKIYKNRNPFQKEKMPEQKYLLKLYFQKYGIDVEMSKDGMAVLEHIRECIGTEVREVTIRECCERDSMEYFEVFASEINFEGLQFTVSTLTEEIA